MLQDHTTSPHESSVPLVSVAITSFHSEKWLPEAVESVLRQRVDFGVEIVIGDDCSSDGTVAVARGFEERHPGVVRVLERSVNLGMQRNYYETFEQCRGRYIAWLDADDYWTDPLKLDTQVRLLESDPTISICAHFVNRVTAEGEVVAEKLPLIRAGRYSLRDIVRANFVPSPSILFRVGVHRGMPESYFDLPNLADWPLLVQAALSGDIAFIDKTMAHSRVTPGSAYASRGALYQEQIDMQFYSYLDEFLPTHLHGVVNAARAESYRRVAYALRTKGDFRGSREAALKAIRLDGVFGSIGNWKALAGALLSRVRRPASR